MSATFFSKFPKINYDILGNGVFKVVPDLLRRVKIRNAIKDNLSLYSLYSVRNGDTPESLAYKFYGSTEFYYVILLLNNITDRYFEWPLDDQAFEAYVKQKYTNPGAVHHYEKLQSSGPQTGNGPEDYDHYIEVNSTEVGAQSVSNYEYERRLLDQRRQIKLLKKSYCDSFETEFIKTIRR